MDINLHVYICKKWLLVLQHKGNPDTKMLAVLANLDNSSVSKVKGSINCESLVLLKSQRLS